MICRQQFYKIGLQKKIIHRMGAYHVNIEIAVSDRHFYLSRMPTIGTVFSIPDLAEYLNIPICLAH